ncbi:hypothetical protein P5673_009602 [Acropora cervicornis]|uniref:Uncharacterized protein n=1 Tax=Acropora cervicornis TaxID=6130 RepID=A0AAD9QS70_ACRCE|nr:hypothetical protein P5673_009602 [Acropora cervicornis]
MPLQSYLNEVNLDVCMVNSVLWSPVEVNYKVGMNKSRKLGGCCPEIVLVLVFPLSDLSCTASRTTVTAYTTVPVETRKIRTNISSQQVSNLTERTKSPGMDLLSRISITTVMLDSATIEPKVKLKDAPNRTLNPETLRECKGEAYVKGKGHFSPVFLCVLAT